MFNRLHLCIKLLPDRHIVILFPLSKLCMKTIFQLNRGSQFYGWRKQSILNPTTIWSWPLWTLMVNVKCVFNTNSLHLCIQILPDRPILFPLSRLFDCMKTCNHGHLYNKSLSIKFRFLHLMNTAYNMNLYMKDNFSFSGYIFSFSPVPFI